MGEQLPLVSIIIPTYNQAHYIQFCLDSCLNQTYNNVEIIVVDDGCTDDTPLILAEYGDKIKVITQKNEGAARALNNGILQSKGELVGWLSSDDAYLPEKTEMQVKQFLSDSSIDLSYTDWFSINAQGEIIREVKSPYFEQDFLMNMLYGNFINGSSVLMKKDVWKEAGGFSTDLIADVDGNMWHKLLLNRKKFAHVATTLIYYRTHNQNQSSNEPLMRHFSDIVICNTLQKASDSFFDQGRGKDGLYDFYSSYIKYLHKSFFWKSALYAATTMNALKPSVLNKFHISIIKCLIKFFNTEDYENNKRIITIIKFRNLYIRFFKNKSQF